MFKCNHHLQGAYTYVVKMFNYTGVSSLKMAIVDNCAKTCRSKLKVKYTIYSLSICWCLKSLQFNSQCSK